jgi:galacturonosyltransferase
MGLYKFTKELITELINQGMEVHLALPRDEYTKQILELGCEYTETEIERRGTNPITDLKLFFHYLSLLRRIKPEVVLTYTIKPNIYGGIACRLMGVPVIANITGLGSAIENKGFLQKLTLQLYSIGLAKAHCVFFQNEPNRTLFNDRKLVKGKTRCIPGSGVNLIEHPYEEYPPEDEAIRFLFIGRIMKEKGVDELLLAAEQVKSRYPSIMFDVVGFYEEGYSERIHDYEEKGVIQYYGRQEEVHSFLKRAHAILLPSYHEGMANVLLEGAATGRPILASRIPGCSETFEEENSGLGFEIRNVDVLVEAILHFIELPYDKKKAMGQAGRFKMEQEFDRTIVVNTYLEEINQVTSSQVTV